MIEWDLLGVKLKELWTGQLDNTSWRLCLSQNPVDADLLSGLIKRCYIKDLGDILIVSQYIFLIVFPTFKLKQLFSHIITHKLNPIIGLRMQITHVVHIFYVAPGNKLLTVNLPMGQNPLVQVWLPHVLWHRLSTHFFNVGVCCVRFVFGLLLDLVCDLSSVKVVFWCWVEYLVFSDGIGLLWAFE